MPRSRSPIFLIAAATAIEVLAWWLLVPAPATCPRLAAGRMDGVEATVLAAVDAERRACQAAGGGGPGAACEAR